MKNSNNTIYDNINELRKKLDDIEPGMTKEEMPKLIPRKNCTDLQLFLTKQFMIDDLTDKLEKNGIVKILYSRRTPDRKTYEVMAYSMPYDKDMLIIKLTSQMYGVISMLSVSVYYSLDVMFLDLREKYLLAEDNPWVLLEKQKPYVFFACFK